MLYYLTLTLLTYTVHPVTFAITTRETTETRLLLNQEEAHTQYRIQQALMPYRCEVLSVKLDSSSICPPPPKK